MNNYKKVLTRIVVTMICFIVIALILIIPQFIKSILQIEEGDAISIVISAFEAVGLIVSLVIAIHQLIGSKEIARATFITELNKSYVENKEYIKLYNVLQRCFDKECPNKSTCNDKTECKLDFPKGDISNYLTFFETIYVLHKNGVVSFEIMDDLFAYRFFLAAHSKLVQQKKLKPQPNNFKNIYCLEKEWLDYRKSKGKDTDASVQSVYNTCLLKDLVSSEIYSRIIK